MFVRPSPLRGNFGRVWLWDDLKVRPRCACIQPQSFQSCCCTVSRNIISNVVDSVEVVCRCKLCSLQGTGPDQIGTLVIRSQRLPPHVTQSQQDPCRPLMQATGLTGSYLEKWTAGSSVLVQQLQGHLLPTSTPLSHHRLPTARVGLAMLWA